jgi:hypothetical protein
MPIRLIQLIPLLLGAALLTGCASGVRPYDGVVGFAAIPQLSSQYRYVDEQRKGQTFVVAQLRKGCAERLGVAAENIQLGQLNVRPLTGRVSQNIQVPTGVTLNGESFQTDRQTVYGQDSQTLPIALIEASARCSVIGS